MGDKSKIEWTDATWNPVRGCSLVSAGCTNCYAMRVAHRLGSKSLPSPATGEGKGEGPYHGLTRMTEHGLVWTGEIQLVSELLDLPLRWKRPRRIFVNSMSDLFHEDVSDEFILEVYRRMGAAFWHTYQILTKRARRMWEIMPWLDEKLRADGRQPLRHWRHVWLGVSVEDQKTFETRWPYLRETPAAVRFLSYEPALGSLDASEAMPTNRADAHKQGLLDWLICGGESGPHARPMHPEWVRSIRDQCQAAGVPFFFKQWGEWAPECDKKYFDVGSSKVGFVRVGKKRAGALLDGREWKEYPK